MPNGKQGSLTAEQFAQRGTEMEANGAQFDFSEFNKVVDGKKGPLFEVMKKMIHRDLLRHLGTDERSTGLADALITKIRRQLMVGEDLDAERSAHAWGTAW